MLKSDKLIFQDLVLDNCKVLNHWYLSGIEILQSFSLDGQLVDGYSSGEEDSAGEGSDKPSSESSKEEEEDANADDEESLNILRIETGRSEAKAICQVAWDF
jgi:hypothetical protein